MRKIIMSMMVSVDGYMGSRDPEEYWHQWDDEMSEYMMGLFKTVDTFIYGRVAYEEMIAYWPPLSNEFADIMNKTPKVVVSKTLERATWNATVVKDHVAETMRELKQQEGKDMVLFAGATTAEFFLKNDLIDEFRLMVNPVVLGGGKPVFQNIDQTTKLIHKETHTFKNGNVLLVFEPKRE